MAETRVAKTAVREFHAGMSMNSPPDYSRYSVKELEGIVSQVNGEKYPERLAQATKWLATRREEQKLTPPDSDSATVGFRVRIRQAVATWALVLGVSTPLLGWTDGPHLAYAGAGIASGVLLWRNHKWGPGLALAFFASQSFLLRIGDVLLWIDPSLAAPITFGKSGSFGVNIFSLLPALLCWGMVRPTTKASSQRSRS